MRLRSGEKGEALWTCAQCCERLEAEHNALVAADEKEHAVVAAEAEVVAQLNRKVLATEAPGIRELCDELFTVLGGVKAVARLWGSQIAMVTATDPGSKRALDAMSGLAKLVTASSDHRLKERDLKDVKEEEIEHELQMLLGRAALARLKTVPAIESEVPREGN
jgi:hypothetical protein